MAQLNGKTKPTESPTTQANPMNRYPLILGATLLVLVFVIGATLPARGDLDFRVPDLPEAPVVVEGDGPYGGDVRGIVPMGGDGWVLWTADAGLFVRRSGEDRWEAAREGLPVTNGRILVSAVAACESRPGFLAAAFLDGWLFASQDAGRSWSIIGLIPTRGETVRKLIIHPGDPSRIMAATRRKVFVSEDSGGSWTELFHPMTLSDPRGWENWSLQFVELLADRLRPGTALILTRNQGAFLTANWGHDVSWFRDNLPGPVDAAALDPTFGTIAYAVTGGDLYRSVNGGETWDVMAWPGRGVLGRVTSLIVDPGDPSTLFALAPSRRTLRFSRDGGMSWEDRELPGGEEPQIFTVHPMGADHGLLLGTRRGVWESLDGGLSWRFSSAGIEDVTVLSLVPGSEERANFWAATDRGLALVDLQGGGWSWSGQWWSSIVAERVVSTGRPRSGLLALAADGLWDLGSGAGMNPLRLFDEELSPTDAVWWKESLWLCGTSVESLWVAQWKGEEAARIRYVFPRVDEMMDPWLRIDPCDGERIFLGYGPLLESDDGEAWGEVSIPNEVRWVWDATRTHDGCGDLLLATDNGIHLRESTSSSWRVVGPGDFDVQEVVVDPLQRGRWFARAFGNVYMTEDHGETWKALDLPAGQVTAMSWDISSERLLVGLQDRGIRWVDLRTEQVLGIRLEPINVSPNPFRDEAAVSFEIHDPISAVELRIYSVFGDLVRTMRRGGSFAPSDVFRWTWDGKSDDGQEVAAGVYVFRATLAGRPYGGKALRMR